MLLQVQVVTQTMGIVSCDGKLIFLSANLEVKSQH